MAEEIVYKIRHLTDTFYRDYPQRNYPEILTKENRCYTCLCLQINDYIICIPYRTEIRHTNAFKFTSSIRSREHQSQLNKGVDFTVNVQGMYFKKNRRYSNPSHQDIFDALACCMDAYPEEYDEVRRAILDIYNCVDVDLSYINAYFPDYEGTEHPIQIILLAIKWLFMEQDCAYWNYSGRRMLFDGLSERGLI